MQFFRRTALTVGFAALVALGHAQNSPRRPDLNAFVNKRVTTTADLVRHAREDERVMDRYMRHYAMSREGVLSFLGTLRPGRLQEGGIYRIYSVPNGGNIRANILRLRKGTPIFVDATGRPVLVGLCGNPFDRGPSEPLSENPETTPDDREVPLTETDLPAPAITEMLIEPGEPSMRPEVITETPEYLPPPPGRGQSLITPVAGLLGLLGSATVLIGDNDRPPPPPVPEPASMLAMAAGLGGVALRRRAKRSR